MDISNKLHELMQNQGKISRSKLARELGVHTSTVSNWLDGKPPKSENILDLCRYFNVTLQYLTGEISHKNNPPAPAEGLTKREQQYMKLFNSLSPDLQIAAEKNLDLLLELQKKQNK